MGMLDGFRDKDFLEQITLLNEIAAGKDIAALPGLVDLLRNPLGDSSIDYMVVNALNAVLSQNEGKTVAGLASGHLGFRTLCIRVAGEYGFKSAAPVLTAMGEAETDTDQLQEILTALFRIQDPESLPLFRKHLENEDTFIQALCIEMMGFMKDATALPFLRQVVEDNDARERYQRCEVATWKAVEALAAFGDEDSLGFLVDKLHHSNPTVRRIITDTLVQCGEPGVPLLGKSVETGSTDEKILASNLLGFIGHRKGGDILVSAMDRGLIKDPNVKYAVYEALGRIGTMKALICLVDGLSEPDDLILMAVVTGLEHHINPGVLKTLAGLLTKANDQSDRLARAVIASKSVQLFDALYEYEGAALALMDALAESRDPEVLEAFREKLGEIGGERAEADLERLPKAKAAARKALAADDSRSMLALHRAILTDLGFEPLVGLNGQEAYAFVEAGETFDVVITDMNMPVMDGMELVEKLRATEGFQKVPVIMVTTESEASQRSLADQAGVTAFITKPFKPEALKDKVREVLGLPKAG